MRRLCVASGRALADMSFATASRAEWDRLSSRIPRLLSADRADFRSAQELKRYVVVALASFVSVVILMFAVSPAVEAYGVIQVDPFLLCGFAGSVAIASVVAASIRLDWSAFWWIPRRWRRSLSPVVSKGRYTKTVERHAVRAVNAEAARVGEGAVKFPEDLASVVEFDGGECVAVESREWIHDTLDRLRGGTFGIVGPRGVGKTSLLREAILRNSRIGVSIEFPTVLAGAKGEAARALLILLARKVHRESDPPILSRMATRMALLGGVTAIAGAALFCALWGWKNAWDYASSGLVVVAMVAVITGAAVAITGSLFVLLEGCIGLVGAGRARVCARSILERHTAMLGVERSASVAGGWLGIARRRSRESLPSTIAEVTEDFRRLVSNCVGGRQGKRVLIVLDELDRLSVGDLEVALNQVKDLIRMEGVVVLASISNEARVRFEQRAILGSDIFDSTFNDIFTIEAMRATETVEMFASKVVGLPTAVALLCHALGGGRPRESLRVARIFVEIHLGMGLDRRPSKSLVETGQQVQRRLLEQSGSDAKVVVDAYESAWLSMRPYLQERGGWIDEDSEAFRTSDSMARRVRSILGSAGSSS